MTHLSETDARVLACVFEPEGIPAGTKVFVDPSLPEHNQIQDHEVLQNIARREREAIYLIEQFEKSDKLGNSSKHETFATAIQILDDLITSHPTYAPAWNDRAQLRRWRYGDHNTICQDQASIDRERAKMGSEAVTDLRTALRLASTPRPQDPVSPKQGRLLAQSYTQLGALLYAASRDLSTTESVVVGAGFEDWTQSRFEEESSKAFFLGGTYGNEVAKALAVHTNPHAKLCGSVVEEAIRREVASNVM
jgi:hypothetical protein